MIIGQERVVKSNYGWACEWDCSSYSSCDRYEGLNPIKDALSFLDIGVKRRNVYPYPYQNYCDCNTVGW